MSESKKTCFIVMPVATRKEHVERYGDSDHWQHVMDSLFVPAIEEAGFEPIEPIAKGSDIIHDRIVKELIRADMVLCDISAHNPNAFFEFGVRTALDKPIAIVKDAHTTIPFDTTLINTHEYECALRPWNAPPQIETLRDHIASAEASCGSTNPMWQKFGVHIKANEPRTDESPLEAKIDVLTNSLEAMSRRIANSEAQRVFRPKGPTGPTGPGEWASTSSMDVSQAPLWARDFSVNDRELLAMVVEGLPVSEIARTLGLSHAYVAARLGALKADIRRLMPPEGSDQA